MAVDIDRQWNAVINTNQLLLCIQLKPGQFCETAITEIDVASVATLSPCRLLPVTLCDEGLYVSLRVALWRRGIAGAQSKPQ